ncbi:MAG: undecaprenyl-phosphate galactose phosphotransferase WbaP [Rhodocyclaceae bacterium]|nr:undecaprenyl-phosphate galactose phosphotransferase WbaP [Rhodocyclaceae bacterium]
MLATMFMVSAATSFVAGLDAGRSSQLIAWALNLTLIPLGRSGVRLLLDDLGLWQRPTVIIGTGENARDAYLAIKSERGMGYHILGFVNIARHCEASSLRAEGAAIHSSARHCEEAPADAAIHIGPKTFPIFDGTQFIETLLTDLGNPQIILALDSLTAPENQTLIQRLLAAHTNIHIIPSIRGLPLFGTQLSHFFSHEVLFLTVRNNLSRRGYQWIKRAFDLVTASLLLTLLTPLFLMLSYQIRRSGGTAFYGHPRVGRNGQSFKCLKFRSMRQDADKVLKELLENDPIAKAEWDKDFKLKNDPRITPVGHFLRKTSLDELPQLINVIKGEMSLVGPRPIVTAELERYGDYTNLYLQVLPGVTGLWQVSGRNDTSYAERVSLDAWYVQNWSLWYDIAILFKTVDVVFNKRGAY